jgi:hypothetical protein
MWSQHSATAAALHRDRALGECDSGDQHAQSVAEHTARWHAPELARQHCAGGREQIGECYGIEATALIGHDIGVAVALDRCGARTARTVACVECVVGGFLGDQSAQPVRGHAGHAADAVQRAELQSVGATDAALDWRS